MKKNFFLAFIMLSIITRFAAADDQKDFGFTTTISVEPMANWFFYSGPLLRYEIKPSPYTSIDIGLKYKDWVKLFFDFDYKFNDNYVGQIMDSKLFTRIAGSLGIKDFMLTVGFGQIEGLATWKGPPVPGQPQTAVLDSKYYELQLYYFIYIVGFGFKYTNYHLPMGLDYAYLDNREVNSYEFLSKISLFNYFMSKWREEKRNGFAVFFDYDVGIGITVGSGLDAEAKRRNHFGYLASHTTNFFGNDIDDEIETLAKINFSASGQAELGLCGAFYLKRMSIGLGAGYVGSFHNGNAGVLLRHGFIIKGNLTF